MFNPNINKTKKILRFLDITFSLIGLLITLPLFIIVSIAIKLSSKGRIFFIQERMGENGIEFNLLKFRSMYSNIDKSLQLTTRNDLRITPCGKIIRKYKLDELPQLINVLKGDMSVVGPRPEVRKYVELYSEDQSRVLNVKPGITDYASIHYSNENEILNESINPEEYYINIIMPRKIELNMNFINKPTVRNYFRIILLTVQKIFK
ncbi:MAG TPA: sugar transferase [Bacteroidales bacterium]|nr:sugar transferase [Bacteroidales bacterium]